MTEQTHEPAPAPWNWEASGKAGSNGLFNLYIVDANGRKIAAVWGKPGEKEATCRMFVAAPELLRIARDYVRAIEYQIRVSEKQTPWDEEGRRLMTMNANLTRAVIAEATGTTDGAADMAAPLAPHADAEHRSRRLDPEGGIPGRQL